jgi:hypothetical protein
MPSPPAGAFLAGTSVALRRDEEPWHRAPDAARVEADTTIRELPGQIRRSCSQQAVRQVEHAGARLFGRPVERQPEAIVVQQREEAERAVTCPLQPGAVPSSLTSASTIPIRSRVTRTVKPSASRRARSTLQLTSSASSVSWKRSTSRERREVPSSSLSAAPPATSLSPDATRFPAMSLQTRRWKSVRAIVAVWQPGDRMRGRRAVRSGRARACARSWSWAGSRASGTTGRRLAARRPGGRSRRRGPRHPVGSCSSRGDDTSPPRERHGQEPLA